MPHVLGRRDCLNLEVAEGACQAASLIEKIASDVSDIYSEPSDNRELAIGLGAVIIKSISGVVKIYIENSVCNDSVRQSTPLPRYVPVGQGYMASGFY